MLNKYSEIFIALAHQKYALYYWWQLVNILPEYSMCTKPNLEALKD